MVQNTKGETPQEKLVSLTNNLTNHLKRKHNPQWSEDMEVLQQIQQCAGTVILMDNVDYLENLETGIATKILMEPVVAEALRVIDLALGVEEEEIEEEDKVEPTEEEGVLAPPEEGVIDMVPEEVSKEADRIAELVKESVKTS